MGERVQVWVVVYSDNVIGVASRQAMADKLYGYDHGQDSFCCFAQPCEVDAPRRMEPAPPRHRPPVVQDPLPL
jgi:hypothetical protein